MNDERKEDNGREGRKKLKMEENDGRVDGRKEGRNERKKRNEENERMNE